MATDKLVPVYLPQRVRKNWLGLEIVPSDADLGVAEKVLRDAFPQLLRIERPIKGGTDKEHYHVTVAYGIEEAQLGAAADALRAEQLTESDLHLERTADGGPVVKLIHKSPEATTVFVLLECAESPRFEAARDRICARFLPVGQTDYKKHRPHVTALYGILPSPPKNESVK